MASDSQSRLPTPDVNYRSQFREDGDLEGLYLWLGDVLEMIPRLADRLRHAEQAGDAAAAWEILHTIKGTAGGCYDLLAVVRPLVEEGYASKRVPVCLLPPVYPALEAERLKIERELAELEWRPDSPA